MILRIFKRDIFPGQRHAAGGARPAHFNDPHKGNCAACHPGDIREGAFPSFSDFGFIALGVPRNRKLQVNADPAFHDLGLCGPDRTDRASRRCQHRWPRVDADSIRYTMKSHTPLSSM